MAVDDDLLEGFADTCVALGGELTKNYFAQKDGPEDPFERHLRSVTCTKVGYGAMKMSKRNNWVRAESWDAEGVNGLLLNPESVEFSEETVGTFTGTGEHNTIHIKDKKGNTLALAGREKKV